MSLWLVIVVRLMNCTLDGINQEKRFAFDAPHTRVATLRYLKVNDDGWRLALVLLFLVPVLLPIFFAIFSRAVRVLGSFLFLLLFFPILLVFLAGSLRLWHERRTQIALQGYSIGFYGARETQVELQLIVDGIENAVPQEVEVFALWIKGWRDIFQHRLRCEMRFTRLQIAEFDGGLLVGDGEAIGQPAAIGGPVKSTNATIVTAVQYARGTGLKVKGYQLVTMVGERDHIVGGRDSQGTHPAKFDIGKRLRFAGIFGVENDQAFSP